MNPGPASAKKVAIGLAAVYLGWGSTYLAIRFAVETIPPFFLGGVRFLVAGVIVFLWLRARGAPMPGRVEWKVALISGSLMITAGNGLINWSGQFIPSSLIALLVAPVPLWLVAIARFGPDQESPGRSEMLGLFSGLLGVVVLLGGSDAKIGLGNATAGLVLLASLAVILASIIWSFGSLYIRRTQLPQSALYMSSITMIAGGAMQLLVSVGTGELGRLSPSNISAASWGSLAYLIVVGSIISFSAYSWLLRVVRPALAGTYAYVNPVVALFLGWWLANETMTVPMLFGTLIIVLAVSLVQRNRPGTPTPRPS